MSSKRSKNSKRLEAFNRSQEIYKALEKGIIENEALMGSAIDRPEDDAHLSELLESTSASKPRSAQPKTARPHARVTRRRSSPKRKASSGKRKRR